MDSDQSVIEEAETQFLLRNFQKSLLLSNQLLNNSTIISDGEEHENKNDGSSQTTVLLETPLCLSIDAERKDRRISIHFHSGSTQTDMNQNTEDEDIEPTNIALADRAATVALQSWYEIARQIELEQEQLQKPSASQGYTRLLPFLNAYTSRPMPLELAVVFVQFLRTDVCKHTREAVELSSEILFWVAGSSQLEISGRHDVKNCLEELFSVLVVEILPFCTSQSSVVALLKRFLQPRETWKAQRQKLKTSMQPNSDGILTILSFLNSMPSRWSQKALPSQECIDECRKSLRALLKRLDLQNQGQATSPQFSKQHLVEDSVMTDASRRHVNPEDEGTIANTDRASKDPLGQGPLLPRLDRNGGIVDSLTRYSHSLDSLVRKFKEQKGNMAFFLVLLLLSWKKRQKLFSLSAKAVGLVVAPIREVVDAVTKPS